MGKGTRKTVMAVILFLALAASSCSLHAISGGSGGYVLWNANEAYFFIEVSNLGFSATGARVPWILFKRNVIGGFAAYEPPADQHAYLLVIRVISSGVERHVLKLADRLNGGPGSDPDRFTPLKGQIYASCPWLIGQFMQDGHLVGKDVGDGLCRWVGDHFEKATEDERRQLDGINRLTKADFEGDENGWSRREFGAGPKNNKFTIAVGDKFRLSIDTEAKGVERSTVSIDLLRSGKVSERIGVFDAHEGSVSAEEYERVFRNRR